ncbi:tyrosine-type recombinase/integrase [Nonomuraea mangrovi]|uniref:Tyrosine-type recombinase/integrase n=1 Tax=Nonomuraea mangrovi TaxID=2316207 RepID=A0ABW4SSS2_9ACTN
MYPAGTPSLGRSRERRPRPRRPHTAATLLIERGVDISVVQEILGYSQLTTTRRYTHITATLSTEAAARMGRTLWGQMRLGGLPDHGDRGVRPGRWW